MRPPGAVLTRYEFERESGARRSYEGVSSRDEGADQRGREEVFAGMVERHSRLMYRVAYGLLRNTQEAEDAVQEAFLKLYRGEAWRQMVDEKAYLARTVWRVALDRLPKDPERAFEAMEDGRPVKVEVNVEIDFHIF